MATAEVFVRFILFVSILVCFWIALDFFIAWLQGEDGE